MRLCRHFHGDDDNVNDEDGNDHQKTAIVSSSTYRKRIPGVRSRIVHDSRKSTSRHLYGKTSRASLSEGYPTMARSMRTPSILEDAPIEEIIFTIASVQIRVS
jgi:hypothetical protein